MINQTINPGTVAKELDIVVSNLKQIQASTSQGSRVELDPGSSKIKIEVSPEANGTFKYYVNEKKQGEFDLKNIPPIIKQLLNEPDERISLPSIPEDRKKLLQNLRNHRAQSNNPTTGDPKKTQEPFSEVEMQALATINKLMGPERTTALQNLAVKTQLSGQQLWEQGQKLDPTYLNYSKYLLKHSECSFAVQEIELINSKVHEYLDYLSKTPN